MVDLERYTEAGEKAVRAAISFAQERQHPEVEPVHGLVAPPFVVHPPARHDRRHRSGLDGGGVV